MKKRSFIKIEDSIKLMVAALIAIIIPIVIY